MRLVCIDVDGTVSDRFEHPTVEGAARALAEIRRTYTLRLVTNATSIAHAQLVAKLRAQGLLEDTEELVTPAATARRVLTARGQASGILIVEQAAREDFAWFEETPDGPAVLLASEAHELRLADLQPAFRRLLDGAELYAAQQNRYFRKDGELVTDLGPVAAFLAYASGRSPQNLGKPSRLLFEALAREARCSLSDVVMVGDDAEFDASGAVALGMCGVLVRTGKYRPGDEDAVSPKPTAVLDSVQDVPAWLAARPS